MGTTDNIVFIGIDLTDPHAKRPRPCARAILSPNLTCTFDEWRYAESGEELVPSSFINGRFIVALDGPQGLAGRPDEKMRACERELGAPGKSPYDFPCLDHPFAGFVCGSVRLFYALHMSGLFYLHGMPGIQRPRVNTIEVYPGAAWRILSRKPLPRKRLRDGRQARLHLLHLAGLTFPESNSSRLPSHDELDAALAAYIAYLFVSGITRDCGDNALYDSANKILREGLIVQPLPDFSEADKEDR